MYKLGLIIRREYLAKVRNKSFVIMTFLSPILLVGMVVLIAYLTKINDNDKRILAVMNESPYFQQDFSPRAGVSFVIFPCPWDTMACCTCRTGRPLRR